MEWNISIDMGSLTLVFALGVLAFFCILAVGAKRRWQVESLGMGAFLAYVIYFQGQTMYDLLVMPVLDLCNGVAPLALWTIGPLVALVGTFAVIGVMVKNMVFTVRDEGGMKAWL